VLAPSEDDESQELADLHIQSGCGLADFRNQRGQTRLILSTAKELVSDLNFPSKEWH
jgi:hypothetical protein